MKKLLTAFLLLFLSASAWGQVIPRSTTTNFSLVKPETTTGSWGHDINSNLDTIDANLPGALQSGNIKWKSGTSFVGELDHAISANRIWTFPNFDGTLATLAGTESLSNKTLPSPIFSGTATGTYTIGGTPTLGTNLLLGGATRTIGDTGGISIQTGGNVGIGQASPTYKLHLTHSATSGNVFLIEASDGSDWFAVSSGIVIMNEQGGNSQIGGSGDLGARLNISTLTNSGAAALAITGVTSPASTQNLIEVNSIGDLSGDLFVITPTGKVGIGRTAPTAMLHLKAGAAAANSAPFKFTSGPLLTTPEAGAVEFLTDTFYGTITTGAARRTFSLLESSETFTAQKTMATGAQLIASNLGIEFAESDTNPNCLAGNYNVYADLSEAKLKKCTNGVLTDLDTGGTVTMQTAFDGGKTITNANSFANRLHIGDTANDGIGIWKDGTDGSVAACVAAGVAYDCDVFTILLATRQWGVRNRDRNYMLSLAEAATGTASTLLLDMPQPTVAGQRDSHFSQLRGSSFDTAGHNSDWRSWVDVTSNAGASTYTLQSRIDAAAFGTRLTVTDAGLLTVTNATISGLTANSFAYSGAAGALTTTAAPTNGQLLIGSTGAAPVAATLTAGTNVTITNGAGSITIASTGGTDKASHNYTFGCNDPLTQGTNFLFDYGEGVSECGSSDAMGTNTNHLIGKAGNLKNLRCRAQAAPGSGTTWTQTARLNGVNTALTCTIADTATTCTGTADTPATAVNDRLTIQTAETGTSADGGQILCTCENEFTV